MRLTKTIVLVSTLLATLGATLVLGGPARAQDESPRAQVEQLLPRLQSDDDVVRELAEKELFKLGEPGRREMERLSRDTDTRRALTALRYLQSGRWDEGVLRDGEESLRRADDGATDVADLERAMEKRFREMQKKLEDALRDMPRLRGRDWRMPDFEMPEIEMPEWPRLGATDDDATTTVTTQGSVTRDGRVLTWSRAADGKVRVTTRDGDGAETVLQADDLEAFRTAHPEVAAELDELVPSWTGAPTIRLWNGTPPLRMPSGIWRWWHDDDATPTTPTTPGTKAAPRTPALGILWAPVSPVLRHHLRLDDRGVLVESVLADTLAARLKIQPMDVLVELGGKPIRRREDIGAALRDAGESPVEAVVIRRGERVTLR